MKKKFVMATYNVRTSLLDEKNYSDKLNNWKYRKKKVFNILKKQKLDSFRLKEDSKEQLTK